MGRRNRIRITMRLIVVDTGVFIRALGRVGDFENFLQAILKKSDDKIVFTTEIMKEYRYKVGLGGFTFPIFERKEKFITKNKIKYIEQSKLDRIDISSCKKPDDKSDIKFIRAALASNAACIITIDRGHLLTLDPYECNEHLIRICKPEKYVSEHGD